MVSIMFHESYTSQEVLQTFAMIDAGENATTDCCLIDSFSQNVSFGRNQFCLDPVSCGHFFTDGGRVIPAQLQRNKGIASLASAQHPSASSTLCLQYPSIMHQIKTGSLILICFPHLKALMHCFSLPRSAVNKVCIFQGLKQRAP